MSTAVVKHIQARLTEEENKEVNVYLAMNDIESKNDWLKSLILREVRKNGTKPIQNDTDIPRDESGPGDDLFR